MVVKPSSQFRVRTALLPVLSLSPEMVQSQLQHPGRDRGDAGGAALPVNAGDSLSMETGAGRHGPLAGAQRGGHQHRHAAVKHRCRELTVTAPASFLPSHLSVAKQQEGYKKEFPLFPLHVSDLVLYQRYL